MTDLFAKYNIPAPRYTSYPTAVQFHDQIGPQEAEKWLKDIPAGEPLSLYVHIPFCRKLCWYCGCSMKVVNHDDPIARYMEVLKQEITHVAKLLPGSNPVTQLHFGGGTPSLMNAAQFADLMTHFRQFFNFSGSEINMEIDPRTLSPALAKALGENGVNRASLGVQDFDLDVQKAINREQPYELVAETVGWLRDAGIQPLNFDLIYGLPKQTEETIQQTVEQTLILRPSRIALFGYAHVPWMKKHQKLLEEYMLPDAQDRQKMFDLAAHFLEKGGYTRIGYDHFALPEDSMAMAQAKGALHRNFQGFTTDSAKLLLGFGASAISTLPGGYVQNHVATPTYSDALSSGTLATHRGVAFKGEDQARRQVLEDIMCQGEATTDLTIIHTDLLADLIGDDLVERTKNHYAITEKGKPFVRLLAACFDEYWQPNTQRHARAV